MPRTAGRKNVATFVGGLNTEASPLTYPENAAKDLDNVDLDRDGSLRRRRGLEYELGYGLLSEDQTDDVWTEEFLSTAAVTVHEWESVQGDDSLNFLVVQIGCTLYFHNLGGDSVSSSYLGKLCLDPVRINDTDHITSPISASSGKGKLFVVSRGISPIYIEYDKNQEIFRGVKLTLKIRDIDGIPEDEDSPETFQVTPTGGLAPENNIYDIPNIGDLAGWEFESPRGYF
jgi:hypothetical protein